MSSPISVPTANLMIEAYTKYMEGHSINMNQQTHCVIFPTSQLNEWMNKVTPYCDEFRIYNGLYPAGEHENRTTVILWPYKDGQPARWPETENGYGDGDNDDGDGLIQPYNEGHLNP